MNTAALLPAFGHAFDQLGLTRLRPDDHLSEADRGRGMQLVLADGLTSQAMETMAGGVFLTAFAVALGASNLTIGLLAATPAFAQLMQIPGVLLVERLRARRLLTVLGALIGRGSLVIFGALMLLLPQHALALLVAAAMIHAVCGSIAGCSWNSWMRDLLPADRLNSFFARRMMYATLVGAILSLMIVALQGIGQSYWPQQRTTLYSAILIFGGVCGLAGIAFIWRTPEPRMHVSRGDFSMGRLLAEPFRVRNYRRLMLFLATWSFAVNLATPFFTVYMLRTLGFDLAAVMCLAVLSQLAHVASIRWWARLADRAGCKVVLRLAGYLFLLVLAGWTLTGHPSLQSLAVPLLIALHVGIGIATAGVTLATAGLSLKLSPEGRATPYLAMNAVASAMAGGLAPIIGGASADFFATRELGITIQWLGPTSDLIMTALQMRHWQFYFAIALAVGLCALMRLRRVREPLQRPSVRRANCG